MYIPDVLPKLCGDCSFITNDKRRKSLTGCPFVISYETVGDCVLTGIVDNNTGYVTNSMGETIGKCPAVWTLRGHTNENDINIIDYLHDEYLRNKSLSLTKAEKADLAMKYSSGDDCLSFIADLFLNEKDITVKESIIAILMVFSDDCPDSLELRKKYRDITYEICSWNNEFIICEWLSYTFLYHSDVLFDSTEAVSDFANAPGDDLFKTFVFNLVSIGKDRKQLKLLPINQKCLYDRLNILIKARNHPHKEELSDAIQTLIK